MSSIYWKWLHNSKTAGIHVDLLQHSLSPLGSWSSGRWRVLTKKKTLALQEWMLGVQNEAHPAKDCSHQQLVNQYHSSLDWRRDRKATDVTCHIQQPSLTLKIRWSKPFTLILVTLLWYRQTSHSFTENKWRYVPVETQTGNYLPDDYFSLMQFAQWLSMPLLSQTICAVHSSRLILELGVLLKFIQQHPNTSDLHQLLELPVRFSLNSRLSGI